MIRYSAVWRLYFPYIMYLAFAYADLTVIPRDTEVKQGQTVRFLCSTSNPTNEIQWFRIPVGGKEKDKDLVYGFNRFNPTYENRFQLEKNFDTGASNLLIPNVEIGDAGKYTCQDEGGNGNRSSAQLIVLTNANADLTVIPRDTEVKQGQTVRFLCSTSNPTNEIQWFRILVGEKEKDKDLVYGFNRFNPTYENRFQLEKNFDTGASNLLIPNVEIGDAGKYTCQDEGGNGNKSSAQLIVLEATPVCQPNIRLEEVIGPNSCGIDADKVVISCSVSHHGNVVPALEWSKVGESIPITEGVVCATMENTTTCNLSMRGDFAMDNTSYLCQAARAASGATQLSCMSDAVKILYAFNSFSIIHKQLNESVHCSANSSQSCNYEWRFYHEGTEKTLWPGRNWTLKDVGMYRCVANCKIKQKPCVVSVSIIHVSTCGVREKAEMTSHCTNWTSGETKGKADETDCEKTGLIIVLVILALVLIGVLFFFFFFFVQRRSWKAKRSGSTEREGETTADNSQAATYMKRPSLTRDATSDYASIDIAGRMPSIPRTQNPVSETIIAD